MIFIEGVDRIQMQTALSFIPGDTHNWDKMDEATQGEKKTHQKNKTKKHDETTTTEHSKRETMTIHSWGQGEHRDQVKFMRQQKNVGNQEREVKVQKIHGQMRISK